MHLVGFIVRKKTQSKGTDKKYFRRSVIINIFRHRDLQRYGIQGFDTNIYRILKKEPCTEHPHGRPGKRHDDNTRVDTNKAVCKGGKYMSRDEICPAVLNLLGLLSACSAYQTFVNCCNHRHSPGPQILPTV